MAGNNGKLVNYSLKLYRLIIIVKIKEIYKLIDTLNNFSISVIEIRLSKFCDNI